MMQQSERALKPRHRCLRRDAEVFSFSQSMKLNASMPPSVMRANCAPPPLPGLRCYVSTFLRESLGFLGVLI
jgi:hypothetical protein